MNNRFNLSHSNRRVKPWRVLVKALILFVVLTLLLNSFPNLSYYVFKQVMPKQDEFPMYAIGYDSRSRHGFVAQSVFDLNILFNAHIMSVAKKPSNQYRVIFLGDSTVYYGKIFSLIDQQKCNGKYLYAYNLGYPHASATKDLMILQAAMNYSPDLIVWAITSKTLVNEPKAFALANPDDLNNLIKDYGLLISLNQSGASGKPFLYGADAIRLQTLLWIDLTILFPALRSPHDIIRIGQYDVAAENLITNQQTVLGNGDYLSSSLNIASKIAGYVPLLIVDMPRPGVVVTKPDYIQYRQKILSLSAEGQWDYLDLSNLLPDKGFVDEIHRNTAGESLYDKAVMPAILKIACGK